MDARLAKNMPGRNARFAGKDLQCLSADTGQSPSVASLAFGEASSDFVGQAKTIEKEHCGEVRCAHERIEREETSKIGD